MDALDLAERLASRAREKTAAAPGVMPAVWRKIGARRKFSARPLLATFAVSAAAAALALFVASNVWLQLSSWTCWSDDAIRLATAF